MQNCFLTIPLIALVSVLFVPVAAFSNESHKVFILHSYEENHVCGQPQHDGIVKALASAGFVEGQNLELQTYYMDTKKTNNTPDLIQQQADRAIELIAEFQPDVLVTLDDNAFRTVGMELADTDIAVVFCGMNAQPEDYHAQKPCIESRTVPGHNITGIYEKLHVADAIRVHSRILPGLKTVKILVDESPTGKAITKQIEIELTSEAVTSDYEMVIVRSFEEYQEEIFRANSDPSVGVIYPVALLLKDNDGNTYTAPQIFEWTTKHSTKPEMALNYAFTRLGLFGGAAVDFFAMGEQAGNIAAKILSGASAGSIPIEDAERYALAFNITRAKTLNITIPQAILLAADEIAQ
ncbi:MAG: ABC transporter substrate binding protein [Candidatus Auribacterota bacterium]